MQTINLTNSFTVRYTPEIWEDALLKHENHIQCSKKHDNNTINKCLLVIRMISEGFCDTEDESKVYLILFHNIAIILLFNNMS